ncbi:YmL10 [Kalmusia sp. IMI 367209]|nr:YmL10 [Kalmusia sp. IMI 367209]
MPPRLKALRLASSLLARPTAAPIAALFVAPAQQRSASILSSLSDTKGAYHKKIRKGRGPASGKGKTAGRGQKGQHAHGKVPAGFQGGQTPLSITKPARGRDKYNPFKVEMSPINLDRIQSWIDQGRLDPSQPITMKELNRSRCLHGVKRHGVKLLGRNADQLNSAIHIIVSRASATAIARIEALGGSVTTRFYSPTSIKRVLGGESHPIISLQADANLVARANQPRRLPSGDLKHPIAPSVIESLKTAYANPDTPVEVKNEALRAVMAQVGARYKYRLPDATARKDIEYYRDPAHRGYLTHTVKEGESPSLFFKMPGEAKDRKKQTARRAAAKASAENRLF